MSRAHRGWASRGWLRRALLSVGVVWGAATVTFLAFLVLPGDKATMIAGGASLGGASPEVIATITAEYGLDQPPVVQYAQFIGRLAVGDLGTSYQLGQPVLEMIAVQLPATVSLALAAAVTGFLLAAVARARLGVRAGRRLDPDRLDRHPDAGGVLVRAALVPRHRQRRAGCPGAAHPHSCPADRRRAGAGDARRRRARARSAAG